MSEQFTPSEEAISGELLDDLSIDLSTPNVTDPDKIVDYTQRVRLQMINARHKSRGSVATSDDDVKVDLMILNSLDLSAQTSEKLNIEKQVMINSQQVAEFAAQLSKQLPKSLYNPNAEPSNVIRDVTANLELPDVKIEDEGLLELEANELDVNDYASE